MRTGWLSMETFWFLMGFSIIQITSINSSVEDGKSPSLGFNSLLLWLRVERN